MNSSRGESLTVIIPGEILDLVERRENGYFQYLKTGHFYFGLTQVQFLLDKGENYIYIGAKCYYLLLFWLYTLVTTLDSKLGRLLDLVNSNIQGGIWCPGVIPHLS